MHVIYPDLIPMQHTPNPEAQDPDAVPPYDEHSELVKQVPLQEFVPVHAEFGNRAIVKSDRTAIEQYVSLNRALSDAETINTYIFLVQKCLLYYPWNWKDRILLLVKLKETILK